MSTPMSPASVPVTAPAAAQKTSWLVLVLMWTLGPLAVLLMAAGGTSIYAVVQLLNGNMSPDDIHSYALKVQSAWVWISGSGGTWFAGVLMRYGLPAYAEFQRRKNEFAEVRIAERVAAIFEAKKA